MRPQLRVGSLFSGIGGLELGLERAGMRTVFQVEIDDYARRVLAKHWPHVPRFTDVREVTASTLPTCDVLCGGFPCQDISDSGPKAGIEGARSGLWGEFARLIREIRPRYVVVENVAALLRRGLGRVLGDLSSCGYDAEWDCLPTGALGGPVIRDRTFLVAFANGVRLDERGIPTEGGEPVANAHWGVSALAGGSANMEEHRILRPFQKNGGWPPEPRVRRVASRLPSQVDRLRTIGNAVSPVVAEHVGRCVVAHWEANP